MKQTLLLFVCGTLAAALTGCAEPEAAQNADMAKMRDAQAKGMQQQRTDAQEMAKKSIDSAGKSGPAPGSGAGN